ncbi:MAG: DUF11 domain-containing protein [Patescibacteria group bacterium]|nr:DUF11 domain-containing protein [Patescibacteria group bacterium]
MANNSPWKEQITTKPRSNPSRKKWVIIGVIFAVVVALIITGINLYFYYQNSLVNQGVGIEFSGDSKAYVGQSFKLTVNYFNNSNLVLKDASLSLILPDNISFLDSNNGQRVEQKSIGDLGPGSIGNATYNLIALGGAQSLQTVRAALSYDLLQTTINHFERQSSVDINILDPIVSVSLSAPQNIVSGENFDMTINYKNNTDQALSNVSLSLVYPPVYNFSSSSVKPTSGNNTWSLNSLAPGTSSSFTITGSVVGPDQSFFEMEADVNAQLNGQNYQVNNQKLQLSITSSPLSVSVSLNDNPNYISKLSDNLNYTITYKNNSSVTFQNAVITAALTGDLYDFSSSQTNGYFNGLTQTFTWNSSNLPELASVAPNQEGSVNLSLNTKGSYPIRMISDKDFSLKLKAKIVSQTILPNSNTSQTVGLAELDTPIQGQVSIASYGYFRDAASGILNSGPFPPKVNQPTEYTIHWIITNYATDISNVKIQANLATNVTWTGTVKSSISSQPTYDPNSNTITWQIDNIPATTGVISPPIEAIFQIKNTPAITQLNNIAPLVGPVALTATDDFTNTQLSASANVVDTSLPNDKTVAGQGGAVIQ